VVTHKLLLLVLLAYSCIFGSACEDCNLLQELSMRRCDERSGAKLVIWLLLAASRVREAPW